MNQGYIKLYDSLIARRKLRNIDIRLYSVLLSFAGRKASCYPAQTTLMQILGCTWRTIRDATERLENLKLITVKIRKRDRSHRYEIADNPRAKKVAKYYTCIPIYLVRGDLSHYEYRLYCLLAMHQGIGNSCTPTQTDLRAVLRGRSETLSKAVKKLVKIETIVVHRNGQGLEYRVWTLTNPQAFSEEHTETPDDEAAPGACIKGADEEPAPEAYAESADEKRALKAPTESVNIGHARGAGSTNRHEQPDKGNLREETYGGKSIEQDVLSETGSTRNGENENGSEPNGEKANRGERKSRVLSSTGIPGKVEPEGFEGESVEAESGLDFVERASRGEGALARAAEDELVENEFVISRTRTKLLYSSDKPSSGTADKESMAGHADKGDHSRPLRESRRSTAEPADEQPPSSAQESHDSGPSVSESSTESGDHLLRSESSVCLPEKEPPGESTGYVSDGGRKSRASRAGKDEVVENEFVVARTKNEPSCSISGEVMPGEDDDEEASLSPGEKGSASTETGAGSGTVFDGPIDNPDHPACSRTSVSPPADQTSSQIEKEMSDDEEAEAWFEARIAKLGPQVFRSQKTLPASDPETVLGMNDTESESRREKNRAFAKTYKTLLRQQIKEHADEDDISPSIIRQIDLWTDEEADSECIERLAEALEITPDQWMAYAAETSYTNVALEIETAFVSPNNLGTLETEVNRMHERATKE